MTSVSANKWLRLAEQNVAKQCCTGVYTGPGRGGSGWNKLMLRCTWFPAQQEELLPHHTPECIQKAKVSQQQNYGGTPHCF